jgi:hypothetical protein
LESTLQPVYIWPCRALVAERDSPVEIRFSAQVDRLAFIWRQGH